MNTADFRAAEAAADALYVDDAAAARALHEAVLEMTHALGEDIVARGVDDGVILLRRREFLHLSPQPGGGLCLRLSYPEGVPDDPRLSPTGAVQATACVEADALDAEVLALEDLIEAAYAQNG